MIKSPQNFGGDFVLMASDSLSGVQPVGWAEYFPRRIVSKRCWARLTFFAQPTSLSYFHPVPSFRLCLVQGVVHALRELIFSIIYELCHTEAARYTPDSLNMMLSNHET